LGIAGALSGSNSDKTRAVTSVVNGASLAPGISATSWITIRGANLAATTRKWTASDFSGGKLPAQLDGVAVTVNGVPAYVAYISPDQLNVLAPDDPGAGQVVVQVTSAAGASNAFQATKNDMAPAFFQSAPQYPAAVHADGSLVAPAGSIAGVNSTPAIPGETIQLFGTGFGPTTPSAPSGELFSQAMLLASPVKVTIAGQSAAVAYAGMTGLGLIQLNVTIPVDLPSGDATIRASIGDVSTQAGLFVTVGK
jgi:uncharacterized protein (TIGR03437 family)